jgi:hypothetical protein
MYESSSGGANAAMRHGQTSVTPDSGNVEVVTKKELRMNPTISSPKSFVRRFRDT